MRVRNFVAALAAAVLALTGLSSAQALVPTTVTGVILSNASVAGSATDSGAVRVAWTKPDATQGYSNAIAFVVTATATGETTRSITVPATSGQTAFQGVVENLTGGTTYDFVVRSQDSNGSTSDSAATKFTVQTVPGSPTVSSSSAGIGSATLTWLAPANTGGLALTGYTISASNLSSSVDVAIAAGNSVTVPNLIAGATYTFSITANNSLGSSTAAQFASVTMPTKPDAPDAPTGSVSGTSITVQWSAPANTGGSDINGYTVYLVRDTGDKADVASKIVKGATSTTFTGVAAGTYRLKVVASNLVGDSVRSLASDVQTVAAPVQLRANAPVLTPATFTNMQLGATPLEVSATAPSGGTVTLTVTASPVGSCTAVYPDPAVPSAVTISAISPGLCTITADVAASGSYDVGKTTKSFNVVKTSQTITFAAITNKLMTASPLTISANSTSSLSVTFSATGTCTVTDNSVTFTGAGSCSIAADQAGDETYAAATKVVRTFTIAKATQTITFPNPGNQPMPGPLTLNATTTAVGLTVSYEATGACSVVGNSVTFNSDGSCTVTAKQAGNEIYSAAANIQRIFSITKKSQLITFTGPIAAQDLMSGNNFGTLSTSTFNASSDSNLPITFSVGGANCTLVGTTITFVSPGTCTVYADQAGNGTYLAAAQKSQTFTIKKKPQLITFTQPSAQTAGTTLVINPTSDSNLQVLYAENGTINDVGVCQVTSSNSSTYIEFLKSGNCVIRAYQDGNELWAAAELTRTIVVNKANQTITFAAIDNQVMAGGLVLAASTTSPLTISYSATGTCSISGGTGLNFTGAGECSVTASQVGNDAWNAADPVQRTFQIAKRTQSITIPNIVDQQAPGTLLVSSIGATITDTTNQLGNGSGNTIAWSVTGGCSINEAKTTISFSTAGTCTVVANQAGDNTWAAATQKSKSFNILAPTPPPGGGGGGGGGGFTPTAQTITFAPIDDQFLPGPFTVTATSSSGLAVSFTAKGACTVSGKSVTFTGVGSCTVLADQAGDATFAAATQVSRTFTIAKKSQTIAFAALADAGVGTSVTLSATATSGLNVSFTASGACTLSGNTLSSTKTGECVVRADQVGDANFLPAAQVLRSFNVKAKSQSITFSTISDQSMPGPLTVSATATSGLAVTFSVSGACTIAGNVVSFNGEGNCTVRAEQIGDSTWASAESVVKTFAISKKSQTISLASISNQVATGSVSVSATATSGLALGLSTSGVCSITGTMLSFPVAGTCTVTATQVGDATYKAATPVSITFTIGKKDQSITFSTIAKQTKAGSVTLDAISDSGLAITYSATGNCSLSGATISFTKSGACSVTANQTGNDTYSAASSVTQNFMIDIPVIVKNSSFNNVVTSKTARVKITASQNSQSLKLNTAYVLVFTGLSKAAVAKVSVTPKGGKKIVLPDQKTNSNGGLIVNPITFTKAGTYTYTVVTGNISKTQVVVVK